MYNQLLSGLIKAFGFISNHNFIYLRQRAINKLRIDIEVTTSSSWNFLEVSGNHGEILISCYICRGQLLRLTRSQTIQKYKQNINKSFTNSFIRTYVFLKAMKTRIVRFHHVNACMLLLI